MAFKMKKPSMTKGTAGHKKASAKTTINRDMDDSSLPDGRAKSSAFQKSYKAAYKDADKSKYKTFESFEKAAKAYNTKKYGTTEPTKNAKSMKKTYKDVTSVESGKKKQAEIKTFKDKKKVKDDVKTENFREKQFEATKKKKTEDAKGPKTKKRNFFGKIGAKLRNTVSKKKVNPNRRKA